MDPGGAHRLLLLFMRANVSKSGALDADEISEISWMPMLGGVATDLAAKLAAEGQAGCSVTPRAWLELCAKHHADAASLDSFMGLCEMMTDTFPELSLPADAAQLDALGAIAQQGGGEKMVNTLCLAAACGNAAVARFILAEYAPDLTGGAGDSSALQLLLGVVSAALTADPAPAPAPEGGEDSDPDDDDDLMDMMEVTVPEGKVGGDSLMLVLEDGDDLRVQIPEGLSAGDTFQVSIERAEGVKPGEEDLLHTPEGGVVLRGEGDPEDGVLLEQGPGHYSEVAALLSGSAAAGPAASAGARGERVGLFASLAAAEDSSSATVAALRICDAHHHFWDLSLGRNPWLLPDGVLPSFRYGDYSAIRKDYLFADLSTDAASFDVAYSVHVETEPVRDKAVEETAWLTEQNQQHGLPSAIVRFFCV